MSTEENRAFMRRYVDEILSKLNGSAASDLVSDVAFAEWLSSDWMVKTRQAFPDFHATLEDMIAEGDEVAVRVTLRGTHTGIAVRGTFVGIPSGWDLPDLPPTGKPLVWNLIAIYHIVNGKMDVHWGAWNTLELLNQVGAIPNLVQVERQINSRS